MKTFKSTIILALIVLAASFGIPQHSFAKQEVALSSSNVCANVASAQEKILKKITDLESKRTTQKDENKTALVDSWKKDADQRAADRAVSDQNKKDYIASLLARAENDAERQAIQTFSASVDVSVKEFRASVDAAYETYQAGVLTGRDQRISQMDMLIMEYKKNLTDALAETSVSCKKSFSFFSDLKIKNNFESLRSQFEKDHKAKETLGATIDSLLTARKQAIADAQATFDADISLSEQTLRVALHLTK